MSNDDEESDNILDYPFGKIVFGGFFRWLGNYMDSIFTALESGELASTRINWFIALPYKYFGHTITVWLIYIIGGLVLLFGIKQLFSK